jgi:hypothetical protein
LEEVQELSPDEVVEGILSAELGLDLSGRFALLNPVSHGRTIFALLSLPWDQKQPNARTAYTKQKANASQEGQMLGSWCET